MWVGVGVGGVFWCPPSSTYQLRSDLKSIKWQRAGTMKLRLAQARDPMRAMNRPKPGTPAATRAMSNTREMRTAAKTMLWDLELYFCLKESCIKT